MEEQLTAFEAIEELKDMDYRIDVLDKALKMYPSSEDDPMRVRFDQMVADRRMLRIRLQKTPVAPLFSSLEQPNDAEQDSNKPVDFKFNANYYVKVKLTEEGLNELKRQHDELNAHYNGLAGEFTLPKTDEDGYSKFPLWDLMQKLGWMMRMGTKLPFETNMIFLGGESLEDKSNE
ncbi:hypothetical protein 043JT007_64 [Bacillus phage 043JT007]|nr:hypothetical protein 043JT007_64 [Bacillus phage 043JT007]